MNLTITKPDPFEILTSTKVVLENAKYVAINEDVIPEVAKEIRKFLNDHKEFPDKGHDMIGNFEDDIQLMFFEISAGFCFWAGKNTPKWGIELKDGTKEDGWYGVCMSFKRAHDEGVRVTDPSFILMLPKRIYAIYFAQQLKLRYHFLMSEHSY